MWPLLISFVLILAAYYLNYAYLQISIWTFTGIVLAVMLFAAVVINFIVKAIKKKNGTMSDTSFIFPENVADKMGNASQEIQFESTVISVAFLMVGSIAMLIYMAFFMEMNAVLKWMIIFNSVCGLVLLGSMLITNYQQLRALREAMKLFNPGAVQLNQEEQS